jgi:hypothetical protein
MADLKNGQTMVDVTRNESRMGDSGQRKRSENSAYLLAGGSSDIYSVTVNFETGHFCKVDGGGNCKGNMHGKGQKFGAIAHRNTRNPQEWCKHVQAALANTEALAEAQEITARAFGKRTETVVPPAPAPAAESAADRLAKLEAEAEALRAQVRAEETGELREAVSALVERFDADRVRAALRDVA